jgi:hypothetical protein
MSIDLAVLSPVSGLLGGLLGASGTLIAAIYQQRGRKRLQRVAGEVARRETAYSDFVILASNLLLHAYTHDEIELTGDEQRLMGLINRMRFFAPPKVVATAEVVLRAIVEIALKPSIEVRQLATQALSAHLDDPLREFSLICKADLDSVRRNTI